MVREAFWWPHQRRENVWVHMKTRVKKRREQVKKDIWFRGKQCKNILQVILTGIQKISAVVFVGRELIFWVSFIVIIWACLVLSQLYRSMLIFLKRCFVCVCGDRLPVVRVDYWPEGEGALLQDMKFVAVILLQQFVDHSGTFSAPPVCLVNESEPSWADWQSPS